MHFDELGRLVRDRLQTAWSKSAQQRLRCPLGQAPKTLDPTTPIMQRTSFFIKPSPPANYPDLSTSLPPLYGAGFLSNI